MDEHHHVRVLLDGAGFADVREHGAVVGAARGRAGELRKRDDRHVQLRGEPLEGARDGGDLLLTAAEAAGGGHELYIVDHDQVQPVLELKPARLGAYLRDGDAGGGVHEHAAGADVDHRAGELAPFLVGDLAPAHALHVHLGLCAEHAHGELLRGHLQREHRRLFARADGRVFDDVHAKAGLSHGRARRDEHQLAAVQAGEQIVQLRVAGGHAFDAAVVAHELLDLFKRGKQHRLYGLELFAALAHGDVVDQALGRFQYVARLKLLGVDLAQYLLRGADELAQRGFFVHDAHVCLYVGGGGHRARKLDQVLRAAHHGKLAPAVELRVQGDQVDAAPALRERAHGGKDLAVGGVVKIVVRERLECQKRGLAAAQHRAEHAALGLQMVRRRARGVYKLLHITYSRP